eukprot:1158541-Pelagomonas_calceolata.AAC.7
MPKSHPMCAQVALNMQASGKDAPMAPEHMFSTQSSYALLISSCNAARQLSTQSSHTSSVPKDISISPHAFTCDAALPLQAPLEPKPWVVPVATDPLRVAPVRPPPKELTSPTKIPFQVGHKKQGPPTGVLRPFLPNFLVCRRPLKCMEVVVEDSACRWWCIKVFQVCAGKRSGLVLCCNP